MLLIVRTLVPALLLTTTLVAASERNDREVTLQKIADGVYVLDARFEVRASADLVRHVITDYENIAGYLPGIRRSIVLERTDGRIRVEQEAVSRYLLFSKTIHLLLDIREEGDVITFRDTCGRSFSRYEGQWRLEEGAGTTSLVYRLTAEPGFEVPDFVINRVLSRDAAEMITHLRAEVARRARLARQEEVP